MDHDLKRVFRDNRRALIVYLTAGDPYVGLEVIKELACYGVDVFEFGVPTSKPKYDGLTIRASHKRAIEAKVTLEKSFSIIKDVEVENKIVLAYFDIAKEFGLEDFMSLVAYAGVKAVIFPDLLIDYLEDVEDYLRLCEKYELERVFFITSSFPHKLIHHLSRLDSAFIYLGLMASTGVFLPISAAKNISIVKEIIGNTPLVVGFAINDPQHVLAYVRSGADGVVVGSAIIKLIVDESHPNLGRRKLARFIESIRRVLDHG